MRKNKIIPLLMLIAALTIVLVGVLSGCNMYVQHTAGIVVFAEHENYEDNECYSIKSGDTREFESSTSEGIAFSEKEQDEFIYEIDHVNTLRDIGGIEIDGREFIVPAETLGLFVYVNVFYDNVHLDKLEIEVSNRSIECEQARKDNEDFFEENDWIIDRMLYYYDALEFGDEYIQSKYDLIKSCEEILKETTDPEKIKWFEDNIVWAYEDIEYKKVKMAEAPAYIEENEQEYFDYLAEKARRYSLVMQPYKGGVKP